MIVTMLIKLTVNVKSDSQNKRWKIQTSISDFIHRGRGSPEGRNGSVLHFSFFARGVTCYGFVLDGDKEREIRRDLD